MLPFNENFRMGRVLPLLLFLIVCGSTSVKGNDPCIYNEVLRFQDSRCPSNILSGNSFGLCDNFMTEGWYRVANGSDIPTSCQDMLQCGTVYPVWMYGTVPSVSDGEVSRTACYSDHTGCCARQWIIRVKNCGSYRVYYIKRTDACPSAYCVEKRMYTTTSEETSSSSSSSQDVTSTSMENKNDVTTTQETTTDIPTTTTSSSTTTTTTSSSTTTSGNTVTALQSIVPSTSPKNIVTDPLIMNNKDLGGSTTSPPIYPESTQSQVVQADPTNILIYILAAAVGVLLLTTLVIAVVFLRSRRKKKEEKEKSKGETSETSKQSQNRYSELPNADTIYYSIEYDKETENNQENERIASAREGNMYLDACHLPVSDADVTYDVASEIEEVSAITASLGNREMYLDAVRGSVMTSSENYVTMSPENTYHDPYECSSGDIESHNYAKLPNTTLKTQHEYSNRGYEPELQDKARASTAESANRGSIVSYDDVTIDLK